MKKLAIAAILFAASSGSAFAASGNTSTTSGASTATVVTPIVLTHTAIAKLGFGKFTHGTGGTITVTALGIGSVTGDVGFVPGSTTSADAFALAGDISRSYSIVTTGGNVTLGATNMAFTTTPSAIAGTMTIAGISAFTVGGTLTVAGTEGPGAYTGSYSATVTYN